MLDTSSTNSCVATLAPLNCFEVLTSRCYACYVLALAGKPNRSAMSRLREHAAEMNEDDALLLAFAYAINGNKKVANEICGMKHAKILDGSDLDAYYYSSDRTLAISALLSSCLGDQNTAFALVKETADKMNDKSVFMSTQTTAWAFIAVSDFARCFGGNGKVKVSVDAGSQSMALAGEKAVVSADIAAGDKKNIHFEDKNKEENTVYVCVTSSGLAEKGKESETANGIALRLE